MGRRCSLFLDKFFSNLCAFYSCVGVVGMNGGGGDDVIYSTSIALEASR